MIRSSKRRQPIWQNSWFVVVIALAIAAGFVWWVNQAEPLFTPIEAPLTLK